VTGGTTTTTTTTSAPPTASSGSNGSSGSTPVQSSNLAFTGLGTGASIALLVGVALFTIGTALLLLTNSPGRFWRRLAIAGRVKVPEARDRGRSRTWNGVRHGSFERGDG
jgi:hypothetical protein